MNAILRPILLILLISPLVHAAGPPEHRIFATSRFSIDEILSRPYTPDVPFGSTGDRLWASSPQSWAFADDIQWLYLTNLKAFDLEVRDEGGPLAPAKARYYPSHVHLDGVVRAGLGASASFTYATDKVENPLSKPFRPEKRWTCWSSGKREDRYHLKFGSKRKLAGLKLHFFDDAPTGGCRPPERFEVRHFVGPTRKKVEIDFSGEDGPRVQKSRGEGQWIGIEGVRHDPERPIKGENLVTFDPIELDTIELLFHHAGTDFYTGLYGVEPIWAPDDPGPAPVPERDIHGDKFITTDDVLVSVLRVHNPRTRDEYLVVNPLIRGTYSYNELYDPSGPPPPGSGLKKPRRRMYLRATGPDRLHDQDVRKQLRFRVEPDHKYSLPDEAPFTAGAISGSSWSSGGLSSRLSRFDMEHAYRIPPGSTLTFRTALAIHAPRLDLKALDAVVRDFTVLGALGQFLKESDDKKRSEFKIEWGPDDRDPVADQAKVYQDWFDRNLAYFDCSDPWVRKLYYHRAYVLHKNMLDPKLGHLKWPTQSEGRWRSGWYPNIISYGAAHQVREARWLRDPKYWQGHLRTWAENQKPDHVYPSHVTPKGPAGGQYTDWISSTAWDGHLVHPDKQFLTAIVDKLADNVRGWQKVYDPDDDGLLLVDSHWWTGMEYQPSFFYFSDYKVAKNFSEPEKKVSLERVDLTAYNFGNAVAVAKIYRLLGKPEQALEFETLAEKIAGAVAKKMWQPGKKFFYSLKADDDEVADVKEVIGVYPFYFGMFPTGQGFESAWTSILDPAQFWTPWPVASASKQCPAYSQSNWPNDGRRAGCMWNGPTWPHANSIVLTAMARTLRASRDQGGKSSPLTRDHLWQLFHSFTKAQYRDQDINNPWTGEFYDGETGHWKTAERDYNHSTWLDILIPEIVGLVPRDDEILEVDPLVPPGKLDYFLLDGQSYRGHDVTIAWDAPGGPDRYGDGRKGLDVYLDGKRVASAEGLERLRVDLRSGKMVGTD